MIKKEMEQDLLVQLRAAFAAGDWQKTRAIHDSMQDFLKKKASARVEATSLLARSLVAQKDRSGARALLKRIGDTEYPKAIHYDFLARAYLDVRNYKEVIRCCERVVAIQQAEQEANN
jgi:uncharacterized protein HemY